MGPIDPPFVPWEKALSKLTRTAGGQGEFAFFSQRRLTAIAREVGGRCAEGARLDFFHGFTPWSATRPPRPYLAHGDCTFRDYMDIYHRRDQFLPRDLERIERAEAEWLTGARRVLFTSDWAAQRAVADYGLAPDQVGVVGLFSDVELPERDDYGGEPRFVFVATNFEAKGGPVVLASLREVRRRHPDASLVVVGDAPPGAAAEPGVSFAGFLRKEVPAENARLRSILGAARALVHPTRSDVAPLIIVEAGYFGCPAISSRRFAIPELIEHRESGILLDDPASVAEVAGAMAALLEGDSSYRAMRGAVWQRCRSVHTKARYEERLWSSLRDAPG